MLAADRGSIILPPTGSPLGTDAGMVWLKSNALGDVSESRNAMSNAISSSESCTPSLALSLEYQFIMAANVSG
jgi:hypothetical protein